MRLPWRRRAVTPPERARPPRAPPSAPAVTSSEIVDLEDQARYHRDRLALYRARMHSARPTSVERLNELERAATAAEERLRTARRLREE